MEEEYKFCKHCGEKISNNSVFCNVCGKRVEKKREVNTNNAEQTLSVVSVINRVLVFISLFMGFIALSVSLIRFSAEDIALKIKINGYYTLEFLNSANTLDYWLSLSSLIFLIAISLLSIAVIFSIVCGKFNKIILHVVFIISLVFGLIYLINGLVCVSEVETVLGTLLSVGAVENNGGLDYITLAFIPFIIQVVLYGIYWIVWLIDKKR